MAPSLSAERKDRIAWETVARWTLRLTVAVQCLGSARWLLVVEETPLLALMWGQPDVGGLGWSEATALGVQQAIGWCLVAATVCVLVRPCGWVCGPLSLFQIMITLTLGQMHPSYFTGLDQLSPAAAFLLLFATRAARIAAPLGLWILDPWRAPRPLSRPLSPRRLEFAATFLRWAIALTFFSHGIEAIGHYFRFTDLNILAIWKLTGWQMSQTTAEGMLTVIGILDALVAVAIVTTRLPPIAYYLAFWGFVTAASRLIAYGPGAHWHELATRAPHVGIPLLLALYWSHHRRTKPSPGIQ